MRKILGGAECPILENETDSTGIIDNIRVSFLHFHREIQNLSGETAGLPANLLESMGCLPSKVLSNDFGEYPSKSSTKLRGKHAEETKSLQISEDRARMA